MRTKRIVVDASIVLAFAFESEPNSEKAKQFFGICNRDRVTLIAPPLYESESDGSVRLRVHQKRLTPDAGRIAQGILNALRINIIYDKRGRARAREIAEEFGQQRVYDATYAALAELTRCELWTGDKAFYDTVKESLRYVRYIGEVEA